MKTTWKRRASQATLLAFMVTSAFGVVGSANADEVISPNTPAVSVGQPGKMNVGFSSLVTSAHERNYLKLIVGQYAPDSLNEWKQALEDRKQAESEMPKPYNETITDTGKTSTMKLNGAVVAPDGSGSDNEKLSDQASPSGAVEGNLSPPKDENGNVIFEKSSNLADPETGAPDGEVREGNESTTAIKIELPESVQRQQKLDEAIEADDAATIKSLLPDMLNDYKVETAKIHELAKKLIDAAANQE